MIRLFLLAAFFTGIITTAQTITWSAARKLSWSDFKNPVKPTKEKDIVALTSTGIRYVVSQKKGSQNMVQLHISAIFNQEKSWKNTTGLNPQALDHEQGHFDIAEIYVRKIQTAVSRQILTKKDFDLKFKTLYDRYYKEYQQFQKKYDEDTNRGLKTTEQTKYRQLINSQLK